MVAASWVKVIVSPSIRTPPMCRLQPAVMLTRPPSGKVISNGPPPGIGVPVTAVEEKLCPTRESAPTDADGVDGDDGAGECAVDSSAHPEVISSTTPAVRISPGRTPRRKLVRRPWATARVDDMSTKLADDGRERGGLMAQTSTSDVAVTSRMEFLDGTHRALRKIGWVLIGAALLALVAARVVVDEPRMAALLVLALLGAGLIALGAYRFRSRGAVTIGIQGDTVHIGSERHGVENYRVDQLAEVTDAPILGHTSPMSGQYARDLRIAGLPAVRLTFFDDGAEDSWLVPVFAGDPAMQTVLARLERPSSTAAHDAATVSASSGITGPRISDAGSEQAARRLWEAVTADHDAILREYAAFEMDPETPLRHPDGTDISSRTVQTFHEALDEAEMRRTADYPGDRSRADAYQQAVRALDRAWRGIKPRGAG